MESDKWAG